MKRYDERGEAEFEELLRDRMNELSDSVDCFDKIAARAFPDNDEDFSDSGSTVSDLENISGRRRAAPVLKWTAAAAAAVLVIGILPKTAMMNKLFADLSGSKRKTYSEIVSRIEGIGEDGGFRIYDLPLEEYARYDVLVTPMYRCPFAVNDRDGMSVRIFVKMCGRVATNEVYAVEYSGTYTESNIVAAAASKARFTDEELAELMKRQSEFDGYDDTALINAVEYHFTDGDISADTLYMSSDGTAASVASFEYACWFKDGNSVTPVVTDVLYWHDSIESNDSYRYDLRMQIMGSKDGGEATLPEEMWETSLSYDGRTAMPESSQSAFTREELFGDIPEQEGACAYMYPYGESEGVGIERLTIKEYTSSDTTEDRTVCSADTPFDAMSKGTLRIYFAPGDRVDTVDHPRFRSYTAGLTGYDIIDSYIVHRGKRGKELVENNSITSFIDDYDANREY